jgi:PncC family amidohydrolase
MDPQGKASDQPTQSNPADNPRILKTSIADLLLARRWRLAVAESATGGLLGHWITQVPGSSRYFWGGVIAYANEVKVNVLNVRPETLQNWGAVSAAVAIQMAQGVCDATGAEVGLSITGIAGPTGATAYKPLGLYYIGLAVPTERWAWRHQFSRNRDGNNHAAARTALAHLMRYLAP